MINHYMRQCASEEMERQLNQLYNILTRLDENKEMNLRFVEMTETRFQDPFVLYDRKVFPKKYYFHSDHEAVEFLKGKKAVIVSIHKDWFNYTLNMYVHDPKPSNLVRRLINVNHTS